MYIQTYIKTVDPDLIEFGKAVNPPHDTAHYYYSSWQPDTPTSPSNNAIMQQRRLLAGSQARFILLKILEQSGKC